MPTQWVGECCMVDVKKDKKQESQRVKKGLHPRNKHRFGYDFDALCQLLPDLKAWLVITPSGNPSVDFSNPVAVKLLNQALLKQAYAINFWDLPEGYLCPPIPGRSDYIHHLADLLAESHEGVVPTGRGVRGLDIGTGANGIYPIIGCSEYGWSFTGTDIDSVAIKAATLIAQSNPALKKNLAFKLQAEARHIFDGVIGAKDYYHFTLCNPPFHTSAKEASEGTKRKLRNLGQSAKEIAGQTPTLNFGGQSNELWCEGGERLFIQRMIEESQNYSQQVGWFTTLVSKKENLAPLRQQLKHINAVQVRTVNMAQGQKQSRFLAWHF